MARQRTGLLTVSLVSILALQSCGSTNSSQDETPTTTPVPAQDDNTDLTSETTPPTVTSTSTTTPPPSTTSSSVAEQHTSTSLPADSTTTTIDDLDQAQDQPSTTLPTTTTSVAASTTTFTGSGSSYTASPDDPFECTITVISASPAPDGERQFDLRIESTSIRGTAYVRVSWGNQLRNHLIPLSLGGVGMTRVAAGLQGQVEAVVFSAADFRPSSERCSASAP
ncbi:MAG: hypothetical protein ACON40_00450 [Ilumatobacteraceae bacterium]